jgi:molecular chaperone HscB
MSEGDLQSQSPSPTLPTSADAFAALKLPRRFDLTHPQISRAYLAASRTWQHQSIDPDLTHQALAVINQAKLTLLNPEARANHLLHLLGGPSASRDRSLPPGFLMQIMEQREALQAAQASADREQVEAFTTWASAQRQANVQQVAPLFAALSSVNSKPDPAALAHIRQILNAWRYIERMAEQISPPAPMADDDLSSH